MTILLQALVRECGECLSRKSGHQMEDQGNWR